MSGHKNPDIDFPAILASSVHEMKNSLSTIQGLISKLAKQNTDAENREFVQLEFEANRMNNNLMQLLILYKIEVSQFQLSIDEHPVIDILNEIVAQQAPLLSINLIKLDIECPEDLFCYCDYHLISNAISTILNNAQRYTKGKIVLSAREENGYIKFSIEDDGEGYPKDYVHPDLDSHRVNFNTGSTGLGLFFVNTIAAMHRNKDRKGFIKIANTSRLRPGGAEFTLFLP